MSQDLMSDDLVDRLSRAARLIWAWEAFELGKGMAPPQSVRYPELAKLLEEAGRAVDGLRHRERMPRRTLHAVEKPPPA